MPQADNTANLPAIATVSPPPACQPEPPGAAEEVPTNTSPSLRPSLSWNSIRSSLNLSERTTAQLGWAVAFLSVLFTVVALSPAFKSQDMTEKALKLAEWTALKDYIEECREEIAAGSQSQACLKAINAKLPPPPYVKPGIRDRIRRTILKGHQELNGTHRGLQVEYREVDIPKVIQGLVLIIVILTLCIFVFLGVEFNQSHLMRRTKSGHEIERDREETLGSSNTFGQRAEAKSTAAMRHPRLSTETSLRRRQVRTHPIYRYASLEEAIHHEDIVEIRMRLRNGEDVNEHWPYLIYRLATTPQSTKTAKRLEIARLCLDFGADINARKAWNGQSALNIAIHFGNVDVAKLLIANGATTWSLSSDTNLTALHHCVRLAATGLSRDAQSIMTMLFDYGAKANQADRLGETPLHKLLLEAWFLRDEQQVIEKLYPVALILIENGACIPETIKEKHRVGNPLWDVIQAAIREREWPELDALNNRVQRMPSAQANVREANDRRLTT